MPTPFSSAFFSAILFKGLVEWKCIHEQCILLQKKIQQQKDFNGPWNSFIRDFKNMIFLWSSKVSLNKVFKEFRN